VIVVELQMSKCSASLVLNWHMFPIAH